LNLKAIEMVLTNHQMTMTKRKKPKKSKGEKRRPSERPKKRRSRLGKRRKSERKS